MANSNSLNSNGSWTLSGPTWAKPNSKVDWGSNPVLDSLTLALFYTGQSYGDTTTPQLMHVHHMQEPIYGDSIYYSNNTVPVSDIDYANYEFIPGPNDSVVIDGDTVTPLVWVNLSDINPSMGEYILQADTAAMSDINTFNEYFNGLYITFSPVNEGGSLVHYDFLNNKSKMTIYYSNDEQDSLQFKFYINLATAFFSNYTHDQSTGSTEFVQQVVDGDTALGREKFYGQGLAGIAGRIQIPYVKDWSKLGIIAFNIQIALVSFFGDRYTNVFSVSILAASWAIVVLIRRFAILNQSSI